MGISDNKCQRKMLQATGRPTVITADALGCHDQKTKEPGSLTFHIFYILMSFPVPLSLISFYQILYRPMSCFRTTILLKVRLFIICYRLSVSPHAQTTDHYEWNVKHCIILQVVVFSSFPLLFKFLLAQNQI